MRLAHAILTFIVATRVSVWAGSSPPRSTPRPVEGLTNQPDSIDVPHVIVPDSIVRPKPDDLPPGLPALLVCGAVVDAMTGEPVVEARVDCSGGLSGGCDTLTDSLGYFTVAVCEEPMVFTAAGYDTLRIEDWTKIEIPCEKRTRACDGVQLRDVVLTQSRYRRELKR